MSQKEITDENKTHEDWLVEYNKHLQDLRDAGVDTSVFVGYNVVDGKMVLMMEAKAYRRYQKMMEIKERPKFPELRCDRPKTKRRK